MLILGSLLSRIALANRAMSSRIGPAWAWVAGDRPVQSTDERMNIASIRRLLAGSLAGLGFALLGIPAGLGVTILPAASQGHVAFEAEDTSAILAGAPENWEVVTDGTASGSRAIYAGGSNDTGTSPHSFVQYSIRFARPGAYVLYYRWRADPARTVADQFTANSVWIGREFGRFTTTGVDGQGDFYTSAANATQAPANNVYRWQAEPESNVYVVTQAQVDAGIPLVLTVGTREAGMFIDRWVFSPEAGLSEAALDALLNSDTSIIPQGSGEDFVAFEAETRVTLVPGAPENWEIVSDATASGNQAIYAGGSNDTGSSPHSFVLYQIRFARSGTYYLYQRWRADPARTVADQFTANSVWIGLDFGSFTTPGAAGQGNFFTSAANGTQAPANNVYRWQAEPEGNAYTVTQAQVDAGVPLVLTVGTREAGMFIDRWVLSQQSGLSEAALDALPNSGAQVAAPEIARVVGSPELTTVTVTFTRPLAAGSVSAQRFALSPGLAVSAATPDPSDPRRVVLTTGPQTEDTRYTLTVNGLTDTGGTPVAPNSTATFTAWKRLDGWATVEIYHNLPGSTVDDLYASENFLDRRPDEVRWVRGFQLNNDPRAPNTGIRIQAFFAPAFSGAYYLYVNNDDEAELLLSANMSEAGLSSLGRFSLSPPVFDDAIAAVTGPLVAGQRYLLEALLKQGGGDVYINVAAAPDDSNTPAADLPVLGGARISTMVNPDAGSVNFVRQPAAATATAGSRATYSVAVETQEQPVYYQWRVNGTDVAGAIRSTYVTPPLTTSDTGRRYSVVVSVAGRDTVSEEAGLTVTAGDPSPLEPWIGVNFVGGGDNLPGRLTAVDVAGVVPQEHWNNLAGASFASVPLHDASGLATPVTLTAEATEHWYSGTLGAGSASGVMLQGFLSMGATQDPLTVTLEGVPAGDYHLIAYSIGFPFQPDYLQIVDLLGAASHPTYRVKAETGLEFNATPGFRRMASIDPNQRAIGNYVQYDNVRPAADGTLTLSVAWESEQVGNSHQPALNGLQLLKAGTVTVRPTLGLSSQGGTLTLTWGGAATGFVLEAAGAIGAGAVWAIVSEAPNPIPGAGSFNTPATGATRYFRLRR